MIYAFVRFYLRRTVANWRALRRECRNALPKDDRKALQENGE
jgi:hypothetical protein